MDQFHQQIRRLRLLIGGGRLLCAGFYLIALVLLLWLTFGVIDLVAAFESTPRTVITIILISICAIAAIVGLRFAAKTSAIEAMQRADALRADHRQSATATLSLPAEQSRMTEFLAKRLREECAKSLAQLPSYRILPWRPMLRPAIIVACLLAVVTILSWQAPSQFGVISQRLLHPNTDIPPYSPYQFVLTPENPSMVYGGDLLISTQIHGGVPEQAVECLIR